jgi:hypothetical protein
VRFWPVFAGALALCLLAELGVRPTGDSTEYLLAARAFVSHGTPDIRASDALWLAAREPGLAPLAGGIERGEVRPLPSIHRAVNGSYYSLHFWLYSLLCAPLLWLTELFELAPIRALAIVNALAACGAVGALWAHFGRGRLGLALGAVFLLSGTTFYLGWTGPEVLTGAAVVLACLAARRGELGLGLLAGAVAAAQNPSAILLWPFVVWSWHRQRRHDRASRSLEGWREKLALGLAAALALLPYGFFYMAYRVPSIIAHAATDFSLISLERAWSLLFDLNEGVLFGLPGLLLAVLAATVAALVAATRADRVEVAIHVAATFLLIVGMAVPTFAIHNWNSASSVFIRYGYWLAMPLVPLLGEVVGRLGPKPRWTLLTAAALLQMGVIAVHGVWGERYSFLRHTWAARFVLRRFPGAYNPVPEIFYERTLGREPDKEINIVVWPPRGTPRKLMARERRTPRSERVCANREEVTSQHVRRASGGWVYLDAPFGCERGDGSSSKSGN